MIVHEDQQNPSDSNTSGDYRSNESSALCLDTAPAVSSNNNITYSQLHSQNVRGSTCKQNESKIKSDLPTPCSDEGGSDLLSYLDNNSVKHLATSSSGSTLLSDIDEDYEEAAKLGECAGQEFSALTVSKKRCEETLQVDHVSKNSDSGVTSSVDRDLDRSRAETPEEGCMNGDAPIACKLSHDIMGKGEQYGTNEGSGVASGDGDDTTPTVNNLRHNCLPEENHMLNSSQNNFDTNTERKDDVLTVCEGQDLERPVIECLGTCRSLEDGSSSRIKLVNGSMEESNCVKTGQSKDISRNDGDSDRLQLDNLNLFGDHSDSVDKDSCKDTEVGIDQDDQAGSDTNEKTLCIKHTIDREPENKKKEEDRESTESFESTCLSLPNSDGSELGNRNIVNGYGDSKTISPQKQIGKPCYHDVATTQPLSGVSLTNGSLQTLSQRPIDSMLSSLENANVKSKDPYNLFEEEDSTPDRCSSMRKKDPFELFSDDDSKPAKYRPIKRKHSSISLLPQVQPGVAASMLDDDELKRDPKMPKQDLKVAYVHSRELLHKVNGLTRIEGRAELVYSLTEAYGLLQYVDVVSPRPATDAEILGFHCEDYINCLKDISSCGDVEEDGCSIQLSAEAENFGLSYDCPLQTGVFETASLIGGASIVAASQLVSGNADVALNWYGGWHHAKRDSASGFCYINDIVLAILKLRERFDRVLYVDIDLHHGDGVEEAFSLTSKVMTVSFHKYAAGFFPGTGEADDVGSGRGKYHTLNIPLHDGIKDSEFTTVFMRVMKIVKEKFKPEAILVQCGADGLSEDAMASFNLSHIGLAKCVCFMLAWNLPTLLLGGGGYNFASTAKCWTFLTALVARKKLPVEIPEHENLLKYGPDYQMTTTVGNRRDCNTKEYLDKVVEIVQSNLQKI